MPRAQPLVYAEANLTKGKLHHFELSADAEGGSIGSGKHTRAIVQSSRLVERANQRVRAGAMEGRHA